MTFWPADPALEAEPQTYRFMNSRPANVKFSKLLLKGSTTTKSLNASESAKRLFAIKCPPSLASLVSTVAFKQWCARERRVLDTKIRIKLLCWASGHVTSWPTCDITRRAGMSAFGGEAVVPQTSAEVRVGGKAEILQRRPIQRF